MPFDSALNQVLEERAARGASAREREAKKENRRQRDIERMAFAARKYAAWDRSDPFTAARCATHVRNGVASMYRGPNKDYGIEQQTAGCYRADEVTETRTVSTTTGEEEIPVMSYRNMARP